MQKGRSPFKKTETVAEGSLVLFFFFLGFTESVRHFFSFECIFGFSGSCTVAHSLCQHNLHEELYAGLTGVGRIISTPLVFFLMPMC